MDTNETTAIQPQSPLNFSRLRIELAKMLKLSAPISMTAEAQAVWITAAIDALEGIRAEEIEAVSAEVRRTVTRPAQIVPEIARLVAEKRKRRTGYDERAERMKRLLAIHLEARDRMLAAIGRREIEEAQAWERQTLIADRFPVRPIASPLTRSELDKMPESVIALGIKSGMLEKREGKLHELDWVHG